MSLHRPVRLALVVAALCMAGCSRSTPPDTSAPAATAPAVASTPAGPAGPAAATPAPDTATTLVAYRWQLASASDAAGQSIAAFFPTPDRPLGIEFADGRLGVTGGCNRISAGYQLLDSTQLQVGQGISTMMACPPPLGDADAAFARFLAGTLQIAVTGEAGAPQLRLAATDGSALTFNGTPTPETRFGGPGARAFLEVSPEPCVAPAPAARPCLMVRDRFFDENGLASGTPGEWRALPDGIEGYTPVEGAQQVVRVKRFEQAGAAGGEPKVHYVLDLVIETRTTQ
jgi:heat shock protein HslJ